MKLKYTGKLGYLEAMYRLNLGDRKKILERIEEVKSGDKVTKKKETESSIIELAEKLFK